MDIEKAEAVQKKYCSNSRRNCSEVPDRMGKRLIGNIQEALPYFKDYADISVLDIGAGDGLGVQFFQENGFNAHGLEFVQERVDTAQSFNLDVVKGVAEDLSFLKDQTMNIFCSHVLEHCQDQQKAIKEIQRVAKKLVYILVPIEFKDKSSNAAHFSPIKSLNQIRKQFGDEWIKVKEEYRTNLEPEGLLIFVRK